MTSIPYSRQDITAEDEAAVIAALRSDFVTQGPRIDAFERRFATLHEVAHATAVANATAGLHIACLALGAGPGTLVWTSPNSFLASANCALYCGADIDFVDIDPATRNMSVAALELKLARAKSAGRMPDIVVPVDFSGLPCDLREIRALGDRHGFRVLQDASHATGAQYLGRPAGSQFAHASVFSFHAVKIVTTAEGGIVTTQDPALDRRLRLLRSHGMTRDAAAMESAAEGDWYYEQVDLGFNYRMTDVLAALGTSQLDRLAQMHARRAALADRYDELLQALPVVLPARPADRRSAWHLYVVEVAAEKRAAVFSSLRAQGIGVNVHYIPIHLQPYYARRGFRRGDFPAAERYYAGALSLPLFPALTHAEQDRVVRSLDDALHRASAPPSPAQARVAHTSRT